MNRAKFGDSLFNCIFDFIFFCHVTCDAENAFLELSMQGLHPLDIHVCDSDTRSLSMQLADRGLTETLPLIHI